jgi:hypothetical protein
LGPSKVEEQYPPILVLLHERYTVDPSSSPQKREIRFLFFKVAGGLNRRLIFINPSSFFIDTGWTPPIPKPKPEHLGCRALSKNRDASVDLSVLHGVSEHGHREERFFNDFAINPCRRRRIGHQPAQSIGADWSRLDRTINDDVARLRHMIGHEQSPPARNITVRGIG